MVCASHIGVRFDRV